MTTPVIITGWEHGIATLTVNGGGLCSNLDGTPTVGTTYKNTGSYALQINPSAATEAQSWSMGTVQIIVARLYFYIAASPTGGDYRLCSTKTTTGGQIFVINTSNQIIAEPAGSAGARQTGPTLSTGVWYRLDFRSITNGTNHTIEWQVNGITQTTAIISGEVAEDQDFFRVGTTLASTADVWYDDLVVSTTSGDYPIGPGGTTVLVPSADGTHSIAANTLEDQTGADINGTSVTAYNLINSIPPSSTTYIRQNGASAGSYAEVLFGDLTVPHDEIIAAVGVLAYTSATTTGNNGATIISKDSFSSNTAIWGTPASPADMSDGSTSNLFYKSAILAGVVDDTTVNALKGRVGYSADATPDPYWIDLFIEVAYTFSKSNCVCTRQATTRASFI